MTDQPLAREELLSLTTEIVSSHVANNNVSGEELQSVIENVYSTLSRLGAPGAAPQPKQEPAVPVKASVRPDYLVCLEDGKKMKTLKRYLANRYNLTPAEYRAKWGLAKDYPMVAPAYAAQRKELALKSGLGRKASAPLEPAPTEAPEAAPEAAPAQASLFGAAPAEAQAPAAAAVSAKAPAKPRAKKAAAAEPKAEAAPRPRKKLSIAVPK